MYANLFIFTLRGDKRFSVRTEFTNNCNLRYFGIDVNDCGNLINK